MLWERLGGLIKGLAIGVLVTILVVAHILYDRLWEIADRYGHYPRVAFLRRVRG